MNREIRAALDADTTALASASILAAEALDRHRDALAVLSEGWSGESACAATDLIRQQISFGAELVTALNVAATELGRLRDIAEESGSLPDPAQTSARLNDRPGWQSPAPPASPASPGSWPVSGFSLPPSIPLPDLGSALVGLVATAADAFSPESVGMPVEHTRTADPGEQGTPPTSTPAAEQLRQSQADPPTREVADEPQTHPQPQPQSQSQTQPQPQPQPQPAEQPLLAAERPPERMPAADPEPPPAPPQPPTADPLTPCEIAADELPQVGQ